MALGGPPEQASTEGEMVQGEVPQVLDTHILEEAAVRPKDIIVAQAQNFTL